MKKVTIPEAAARAAVTRPCPSAVGAYHQSPAEVARNAGYDPAALYGPAACYGPAPASDALKQD